MLVHKRTMGVLVYVWKGDLIRIRSDSGGGKRSIPKYVEANFKNLPECSPDEYWEVNNNTPMAKLIISYYPFISPVVDDDGNLVNVLVFNDKVEINKTSKQRAKKEMEMTMLDRGYKSYRKHAYNRTNLIPFVKAKIKNNP